MSHHFIVDSQKDLDYTVRYKLQFLFHWLRYELELKTKFSLNVFRYNSFDINLKLTVKISMLFQSWFSLVLTVILLEFLGFYVLRCGNKTHSTRHDHILRGVSGCLRFTFTISCSLAVNWSANMQSLLLHYTLTNTGCP